MFTSDPTVYSRRRVLAVSHLVVLRRDRPESRKRSGSPQEVAGNRSASGAIGARRDWLGRGIPRRERVEHGPESVFHDLGDFVSRLGIMRLAVVPHRGWNQHRASACADGFTNGKQRRRLTFDEVDAVGGVVVQLVFGLTEGGGVGPRHPLLTPREAGHEATVKLVSQLRIGIDRIRWWQVVVGDTIVTNRR